MGMEISSPNYVERDDDLLFPPETVERIVTFLGPRDLCVCREVCWGWLGAVGARLASEVVLRVGTEGGLAGLAASPLPPTFSALALEGVDLSRPSLPFWAKYSPLITTLRLINSPILPRNSNNDFELGCPNLKELSLRSMDKYFMMGGHFLQLNQILCLDNLESLDLSNNKYLSDQILFGILDKTRKLKSLNLSSCNLLFVKAVHNRFYPKSDSEKRPYSDNILSFETLVTDFLRGSNVRDLTLRSTSLNSYGISLISDPHSFKWECIDVYDCRELKLQDYVDFISKHKSSLRKLVLSAIISKKLSERPFVGNSFPNLEDLEIACCTEVKSLSFLGNMPNLKSLDLGSCNVEIKVDDFLHVPKLEVLNLSLTRLTSDLALRELCPKLMHMTDLNLAECGTWVTDQLLQSIIRHLRKLRKLNVQRSAITDRGLVGTDPSEHFPSTVDPGLQNGCLSRLADLKELNLSHCQDLGEATWTIGLRLRSLAKLDLSFCPQITPKGIESIAINCPSLEDFSLLNCGSHITAQPELIQTVYKNLYRLRRLVI